LPVGELISFPILCDVSKIEREKRKKKEKRGEKKIQRDPTLIGFLFFFFSFKFFFFFVSKITNFFFRLIKFSNEFSWFLFGLISKKINIFFESKRKPEKQEKQKKSWSKKDRWDLKNKKERKERKKKKEESLSELFIFLKSFNFLLLSTRVFQEMVPLHLFFSIEKKKMKSNQHLRSISKRKWWRKNDKKKKRKGKKTSRKLFFSFSFSLVNFCFFWEKASPTGMLEVFLFCRFCFVFFKKKKKENKKETTKKKVNFFLCFFFLFLKFFFFWKKQNKKTKKGEKPKRNAFKVSMIHVESAIHKKLSQFAAFFIDTKVEISVVES